MTAVLGVVGLDGAWLYDTLGRVRLSTAELEGCGFWGYCCLGMVRGCDYCVFCVNAGF